MQRVPLQRDELLRTVDAATAEAGGASQEYRDLRQAYANALMRGQRVEARTARLLRESRSARVPGVTESPPDEAEDALEVLPTPQAPCTLPSRWEVPAGSLVTSSASDDGEMLARVGHLQVGPRARVKYVGPGKSDSDAAHILADKPVPRDRPVYCFEVEIISKGADGYIGIGLAKKGIVTSSLPGWKTGSYGYHGDDGKAFGGSGEGIDFGPTFTTGDVITCIWCQVNRTISFAKNGVNLGVAFRDVPEEKLYPTIGLRTQHEEVEANFGVSAPLRSGGVQQSLELELTSDAVTEVEATALPLAPWAPRSGASLHDVVHAYLQHSGYPAAARAMEAAQLSCPPSGAAGPSGRGGGAGAGAVAMGGPGAAEDADARAEVQAAVLAGDIDRAERVVESLAPGLLEEDDDIRFRMNCQRFMEMCLDGNDAATISYGLQHLSDSSASHPSGSEMLADAAIMLAFPDSSSHNCTKLRINYRRKLAAAINSCLQVRAGRPPHSALERMLTQLSLVHGELERKGDTLMSLLDLETQGLSGGHGEDPSQQL